MCVKVKVMTKEGGRREEGTLSVWRDNGDDG
jgi:hypothetical protein